LLASLIGSYEPPATQATPVFSAHGHPLTRFGIYKIVRRHSTYLDDPGTARRVTPHLFRHTAAVHLVEAGVEVNVIRGWLGHADLLTTNRYAEINTKAKEAALRAAEPPGSSAGFRTTPVWRSDESLLKWLDSL
jgi:integrase/recombinase XerD